jgi:hypothetical protein
MTLKLWVGFLVQSFYLWALGFIGIDFWAFKIKKRRDFDGTLD